MNLPPPDADKLRTAVFDFYEREQKAKRPKVIAPSMMGMECRRAFWLAYHWASPIKKFPGRMLRLFGSGHAQEKRIIEDLKAAGWEVYAEAPGGKQIAIQGIDEYLFGYIDGIGRADKNTSWCVVECKSSNDKGFKVIVKKGVKEGKRDHWVQMQTYMHHLELPYCLYAVVNKDNDDLHTEIVPYEAKEAQAIMADAAFVKDARLPPARICQSADSFAAKFCDHVAVCLLGEPPQKNCRTCEHITTPGAGKWACKMTGVELNYKQQEIGCEKHQLMRGLSGAF